MFFRSFVFLLFSCLSVASAQTSMWGTGMWGGMQSCGYGSGAGAGSSSNIDGIREAQNAQSEAERKLRERERQLTKLERELEKARQKVESSIDGERADFLFTHMDDGRSCEEYKCHIEGNSGPCPPSRKSPNAGMVDIVGYSQEEWIKICAANRLGGVNGAAACNLSGRNREGPRGDCPKGVDTYAKKSSEKRKLQKEIEKLRSEADDAKEKVQTAKEEMAEDLRKSRTEGGVCIECLTSQNGSGPQVQQRGTDWAGVLSNVGVGLAAMYMGYQTNKMVVENNSAMGWPSQAYPTWSYGFPYLMNGLYGALGGGIGQGAFGCGSGQGGTGNWNGAAGMTGPFGQNGMYSFSGGGAFGYPSGMMGQMMGGGMYNQGMGPWGMSGPYGMTSPYTMMGMGYLGTSFTGR